MVASRRPWLESRRKETVLRFQFCAATRVTFAPVAASTETTAVAKALDSMSAERYTSTSVACEFSSAAMMVRGKMAMSDPLIQ